MLIIPKLRSWSTGISSGLHPNFESVFAFFLSKSSRFIFSKGSFVALIMGQTVVIAVRI
jgi:hypothetical protein